VELAGLEPATSWVRSMSGWGPQGTRGDDGLVFRPTEGSASPALPSVTHHNSPHQTPVLADLDEYMRREQVRVARDQWRLVGNDGSIVESDSLTVTVKQVDAPRAGRRPACSPGSEQRARLRDVPVESHGFESADGVPD